MPVRLCWPDGAQGASHDNGHSIGSGNLPKPSHFETRQRELRLTTKSMADIPPNQIIVVQTLIIRSRGDPTDMIWETA